MSKPKPRGRVRIIRDAGYKSRSFVLGAKLLTLKKRLQLAMAQRRREERARKVELHRLDNEEDTEKEEEEMTDSEGEEVRRVCPCL